jgi:hypothetical protein
MVKMDFFNDISQILIALTSLFVSIIALRISKRISLERNLKDLQFDVVLELIKEFSKETLFIRYKEIDGEERTTMTTFPEFKSNSFKNEYSNLFKPKYFLLTNHSGYCFAFLKYQWNPLLPKSIRKELRKFSSLGQQVKRDELHNLPEYVFIDISPNGEIEYYSFPTMFEDFKSFYNNVNTVMEKINEWLESHNAKDIRFDSDGE